MTPRKTLFLLLLAWLPRLMHGQLVTDFLWQNTIGSHDDDILTDILPLPDGRLLVCGSSNSPIGFDKSEPQMNCCWDDYWIVMLDTAGEKLWDSVYGGNSIDKLVCALPMQDGGFMLAGHSSSGIGYDRTEANMGESDYWLVRIDAAGNRLWDAAIGGNKIDQLTDALVTDDQHILLVGFSGSNAGFDKSENPKGGASDHDYWIVKVDTLGEVIWENTIGGNRYDEPAGAVQTADGGYMIVGSSASGVSADKSDPFHGEPGPPTYDYWLVKIGPGGNVQWDKTIGGEEDDIPTGILDCGDGTYLLYGYSFSPPGFEKTGVNKGMEDYWLVHVDADGNILWDRTIGGYYSDVPTSMIRISGTQYMIGGWSTSAIGHDKDELNYGGKDFWLVSTDSNGVYQYGDGIGCSLDDAAVQLYMYPDSSILVAGYSTSDTCADKDEINQTSGLNAPDYFVFRIAPYQWIYVYGSDNVCAGDTYMLPWGEETDTFGVFLDTIHTDVIDSIYTFELEQIVLEDSIASAYWIGLWVYDCSPATVDYTWIDCATGDSVYYGCELPNYWELFPEGYYAYIVEDMGCVDTSDCVLLIPAGIANIEMYNLRIFPNPGNGSIQIAGAPIGAFLEIRDLYGQIIFTTSAEEPELLLDISAYRSGMYQIRLTYDGRQSDVRYIKVQ